MANTLLTNSIIANEALVELKNNLIMARMVDRQYQNVFSNTTGSTIQIRKPTRYTIRNGATLAVQDILQRTVNLTINYQDGVDVAVTSSDLALSLDSFNNTILRPAMLRLANQIDQRLYALSTKIYNSTGTAGTAPNSFPSLNNAAAVLNRFGVDMKDRYALLSSDDAAALQNGSQNYFNESFNKSILFEGSLGRMAGFDIASVQHIIRPIASSIGIGAIGTPAVDGASQTGSSLIVDGLTASTANILEVGAIFTIAGLDSVTPNSGNQSTNKLQSFTVTAPVSSNGAGQATIPISPSIITSGPYQTVTGSPADNALLTVNPAHTKNLCFNKEAFTLAMISMPDGGYGVYQKTVVDPDAGISIRMSRQYDITDDRDIIRFDVLYGLECFPEYACILMGS